MEQYGRLRLCVVQFLTACRRSYAPDDSAAIKKAAACSGSVNDQAGTFPAAAISKNSGLSFAFQTLFVFLSNSPGQTGRMMHALFVDDDKTTLHMLAEVASAEGFTTAIATSVLQAQGSIEEQRPDVVLLNVLLPDGDGMQLLRHVVSHVTSEVIIMTSHSGGETTLQALRMGAADCLIKPVNTKHLRAILLRLLQPSAARNEAGEQLAQSGNWGYFGRLLGTSAVMQKVYLQVERVAPTSATVFITGESGTGKELVAQTLHDLSRRCAQPFVAVNCGAISPQLIESELFGHEKGSFTGALREHKGYFERASGGTLFLDEITEMPAELQVKLLRVLEARTFMRVGSGRELEMDVRVIAATNRIPEEAVAEGKLREDLLYRLQVFPLYLPPLRQRGKDVELLASEYLDELNRAEHSSKTFAPDALELLNKYHWPGNVRELKNAIQRAYILADDVIDASSFPLQSGKPNDSGGPFFQVRVGCTVAEVERRLILATLDQCQGTKEKAADILGISLKTLYNRLREYDSQCELPPFSAADGNPEQRGRINPM
jgi:two-component system, NtrC family, response regulator AtoC